MHELKIAVTLGHQVVVKLESGQIMTGLPKWGLGSRQGSTPHHRRGRLGQAERNFARYPDYSV